MDDRERLAELTEEVCQLRAKIEKYSKPGPAAQAMVDRLTTKAQAKMVELADLQAKLLDE